MLWPLSPVLSPPGWGITGGETGHSCVSPSLCLGHRHECSPKGKATPNKDRKKEMRREQTHSALIQGVLPQMPGLLYLCQSGLCFSGERNQRFCLVPKIDQELPLRGSHPKMAQQPWESHTNSTLRVSKLCGWDR